MNRDEYDDREERELVMPFVCVESAGGAYADDAFTAGFAMGQLYGDLAPRRIAATTEMVRTPSFAQADLIAMHLGYSCEVLAELDDGWMHVGFTRVCVSRGRTAMSDRSYAVSTCLMALLPLFVFALGGYR